MCGITGAIWTSAEQAIEDGVLDRMTDVLAHRGPDGRGTYRQAFDQGGVALGHRRLSIIDLAGGKQPQANEDETIWISFNGEIYNYRELRPDLEAAGHVFRTNSDTETIVHLYEQHGLDLFPKLRGMFAFAIWDSRLRRLVLARDRMGQKPVVYRHEPGRLIFASEIKALLQVPGISREVDPVALQEYLIYNYVPHPRTILRGIQKLPPAHYAVFERGQLEIRRYWNPDLNAESDLPLPEIRARLRETLSESVRLRLRSDVPLGAFLSGGIDSTMIVGLMQKHLPNPAQTYTIGFPVSEFDETEPAALAARHLKTEHHHLQVQPDSLRVLPSLAWHFDEPFADSSAIPTWYVSRMTRDHVTVALTGDGGDELFAGYPRYQTVHQLSWFDTLPGWLRRAVTSSFWEHVGSGASQASLTRRMAFRMGILRQPLERRYVSWVCGFQPRQVEELLTLELRQRISDGDPAASIVQAMERCAGRPAATRAMLTDLQTYLPGDLLAKVDITSMAHGLECRSPFMDHHFVELAMSIPYRLIRQGQGAKPLLTSTFPELVPPALRNRSKMGFRIPLDDWFRTRLRDDVRNLLLAPETIGRGYFQEAAVRQLLAEHDSGKWNHGDRLWSLMFFEIWHRTFLDGEPPLGPLEALSQPANTSRRYRVGVMQ